MPTEKIGANESDPLTDKNSGKSPSGEGQNPQKSTEQLLAEYKAENARKQEALEGLRAEIGELKGRQAELENKTHLTKREESELEDIDSQINALKSQKETKPWFTHLDRELEKREKSIRSSVKEEFYEEQMNEWLEEKAEEEGIDFKDLRKELLPFAGKYLDKNLLKRAKLAYKDRVKMQEFEKREAELKKKERELDGYREDDGNIVRDEDIKKMKMKDATTREEKLAIIANRF